MSKSKKKQTNKRIHRNNKNEDGSRKKKPKKGTRS